jgi:uncharacterized protein (TIGR04255 family)
VAIRLPIPDTARLGRAPLELVVFQIRYDPQLRATEAQVALAFHDAIGGRDGAFPNIDPINTASIQVSFAAGLGATAAPVLAESSGVDGWRFSSTDGAWTVQLTRDFAALQTTRYETWEESFSPRLDLLIHAVAAHIAPRVEQRLGLRYVDRIRIPGLAVPVDWRPYIVPELLGLAVHPDLGRAITGAQQQLVLDLGEGGVQCGFRHGFLREPTAIAEIQYFLDYDVFRQAGRAFDVENIRAAAAQFNTYALQLFQACVTPELLGQLR